MDAQQEQRKELANRHGFDSYADLFSASTSLPMTTGDPARSYVARRPNGNWFIWQEIPDRARSNRDC